MKKIGVCRPRAEGRLSEQTEEATVCIRETLDLARNFPEIRIRSHLLLQHTPGLAECSF